jgi:hypothetical protein
MAFTHDIPYAVRNYPIAYSTSTALATTSFFDKTEGSTSRTIDFSRTSVRGSTDLRSFDSSAGVYTESSLTSISDSIFISGPNTDNINFQLRESTTFSREGRTEYSKTTSSATFSEFSTRSYNRDALQSSLSYTQTSSRTGISLFDSSTSSLRIENRSTYTYSNSGTRQTFDTDGNSGEENTYFYEGRTKTSFFESSGKTERDGSSLKISTSFLSASGLTSTDNGTGGATTFAGADNGGDQYETTIPFYTASLLTSSGKKTLFFEGFSRITATTSVSKSYSLLSSDLLQTISSSYSLKTTSVTANSYIDITYDTFVAETQTLTNFTDRSYRVSTIHGGGAFIVGGETLGNLVVTGASLETTFSYNRPQPTDFNTYTSQAYTEGSGSVTITQVSAKFSSADATRVIGTTSGDTQILASFVSTNETVDFGRSINTIRVLTSRTFISYFNSTTISAGLFAGTVTDSYANSTTVEFSGFTAASTNGSSSYLGSDGFETYSSIEIYSTMTTFPHVVGFLNSLSYDDITLKVTRGVARSLPYSDSFKGFRTIMPRVSYLTYDKGIQGGIQYESSSDISNVVRSFYPVSVADEVITTATMTSPAATVNLSVNSAESNSYFSAGLPLGLNISLNRYMSFLPIDGIYGSIFSTAGDSESSSNYVINYEDDGSSLVRFTSTGKYSTSQIVGSDQNSTGKTTQAFSSVLDGLVKIQQGQQYNNGKKTRGQLTIVQYPQSRPIYGGQKFTNREGLIIYQNPNPPKSFYVFGKNNSSLITQDSTDIDLIYKTGTLSLPANSVVFDHFSSFITAANIVNSPATYDRRQQ